MKMLIPESIEHRWEYSVYVAPVHAVEQVAGSRNDLRGILLLTRIAGYKETEERDFHR